MKIHGETIHVPGVAYVAIPRQGHDDIVFTCKAVLNYEEFEAICPAPDAPWVVHRTEGKKQDLSDREYVKARGDWAIKQNAWMALKSLSATPGLEWDTVDWGDPETWPGYTKELMDAGFSPMEISRILDAIYDANGLNQDKIEAATKRFLSGVREKAAAARSQPDAQSTTSPGEPVSAST
jgi:hypothetical protein